MEVRKLIKGGYTKKLLRIDLTNKSFKEEAIPEEFLITFLGGRGLAAKYYYDEIPANADAFSPENKIIFMTGPLTGTPAYSSAKFQLATKSPLSGAYICSNSGGSFGPYLKFCGYDGVIFEGKSENPVYVSIFDNKIEFNDAAEYMGQDTEEITQNLKKRYEDNRLSVMSIGQAGENLVRFACIQVDERSFGRGGGGAVMASKNLKAVVIKGTGKVQLADEEKVTKHIKENFDKLRQSKAGLTKYGTAELTETINTFGCYPTDNFKSGVLENPETIYAPYMVENYKVKNAACYRCALACAQVCEVKEGPFKGAKSDPEYETVDSFGAQCGVRDMAAIIAANMWADRLGMDAMQVGTTVAMAMELYEEGIIGKEETGGIDLKFGNGEAMVEMIKKIGLRQDIGDLLALGFIELAKVKPEWSKYMVHAKGLAYAAYEPRGFYGMGLAYGTSNRGACHNVGGYTVTDELKSGKYDRFGSETKGKLVKNLQDARAFIDCTGICNQAKGGLGLANPPSGTFLEDVTGYEFTPKLLEIGERVYNLERAIITREGMNRKDDYLAERTMNEPLPSGQAKGSVLTKEKYDIMLDEYYIARGWDNNGIPKEETLKSFGII